MFRRGYRFFGGWSDPPTAVCNFFFACWFAQGPATIWICSWNSCMKPPPSECTKRAFASQSQRPCRRPCNLFMWLSVLTHSVAGVVSRTVARTKPPYGASHTELVVACTFRVVGPSRGLPPTSTNQLVVFTALVYAGRCLVWETCHRNENTCQLMDYWVSAAPYLLCSCFSGVFLIRPTLKGLY